MLLAEGRRHAWYAFCVRMQQVRVFGGPVLAAIIMHATPKLLKILGVKYVVQDKSPLRVGRDARGYRKYPSTTTNWQKYSLVRVTDVDQQAALRTYSTGALPSTTPQ